MVQAFMGSGARRVFRFGGALLWLSLSPWAQAQEPRAAASSPVSARAQAPFDLTGYWVSLITQNWRFRMVLPGRGDYAGIPINPKGKQFADAWQPAADIAAGRQCEAYGAPSVMQIPERLRIGWQDDETLRVDTDEGMQTRLLYFGAAASAPVSPSLQGTSRSRWAMFALTNPAGAAAPQSAAQRYGTLVVTTEHLMPGLLRKNGVPYGAQTKLSEYWKLRTLRSTRWLLISTKVTDPEYLAAPYVYDSIFQQEPDGARWAPGACSLTS